MMIRNPAVQPSDLPTGLKGQSFTRFQTTTLLALTSGRLLLVAVPVAPGAVIGTLSFVSSTTALAGGTNAWAAAFDASLNLLGQSANDTSPTWAANTKKDFTLAFPVTSPSSVFYAGIMVAASTPPSLVCINPANGGSALSGLAPALGGLYNTGLTATAPSTASGFTASSVPWAGYL